MQGAFAVTGGTGFIGREVIRRLVERGWPVRALTRRKDAGLEADGVTTIQGTLEDEAALARLVEEAAGVVHCAGAIAAPDRATFQRVNAAGAERLAAIAAATELRPRFLLLSSLAAREPALSPYAESKRLGEDRVRRAAGDRVRALYPAAARRLRAARSRDTIGLPAAEEGPAVHAGRAECAILADLRR